MDGTQFDTIAQRLAAAATRRRIVAGVLGSAALLTGALAGVDAKKGGKGKGKKKAKGKTKVYICHKTDDGGFEIIRVGAPAVKGHTKHGDVVCEAGVCQTGNPTGCDQTTGACTGFALAAEDTDCTAEGDEVPHACDAEGNCAAV